MQKKKGKIKGKKRSMVKKTSNRHAHTITGTIPRIPGPLRLLLLMLEKNLCHSKLAKCYLNA